MRFIGRFLWLAITLMTVTISMVFAASNDSEVTLHLWPFETGLSLPLWLAVLGALSTGIVVGALVVWLSTVAIRTKIWHTKKKLKKTEKQMDSVLAQLADVKTPSSTDTILIPPDR